MISTQTPLRISLVGGGTDVPAFYRQYGGAVVSFSINKYVYVSVNPKFDGRTRASYSQTEIVDSPIDLKHDLIRECMKVVDATGLEITTVADVPGEGSGLGSSSSLTVGLLSALSKQMSGRQFPMKMLAETAFMVERKEHEGVGKQDQYAAAYGGFHYFQFDRDEHVSVEPILMDSEQREYMENHLLMLWTGKTRSSGEILAEQASNLSHDQDAIDAGLGLQSLAYDLANELQEGHFQSIGAYLHKAWMLKKRMARGISDSAIDDIYRSGLSAGAIGGKLLGAGGGGFFLFFADPKKHTDIINATGLRQVAFKIENEGSRIVYNSEA